MTTDLVGRARDLLARHHNGTLLVLPNVWDAWSARAVVEAGFPALAIGSHPLADSLGRPDGEGMSLTEALDGIARICAAVDVPVTADMESGYDTPADELIERVLAAGAVGINIEDTVHSEDRMREPAEHADYIAALRAAADASGVDVVINARTDALLVGHKRFDDPVAEAITRLTLCAQAGARCLYPVALQLDAATIAALVTEIPGPINVIANPRTGTPAGGPKELAALGVARVTFGPLLQRELTPTIGALVADWSPAAGG